MKLKDYFNLGCRLFGVYFIFLSVPLFISAITSFYPATNVSSELENYFIFYKIITRALPLLYVFIGFQLIKNSEKIFLFSYKGFDESNLTNNPDKFHLFLKMLGIYFIADYLPILVKSVTSYLTYSNTPKVYDILTQQQYVSNNFFQSLVAIIFGLYLLKNGKHIVHLGFKNIEKQKY